MNITELAREAGFHINGGDIFSPHRKENISPGLDNLLVIIERELLAGIAKERDPTTLNYSTNVRYAENVSATIRKMRS